MEKVKVYNLEGTVVKEIDLNDKIFNIPLNEEVVHQVVVSQMANKRDAIAHAKDRGEIRGGGRKPWRQKGTGRARHGSIRSPLWIGGGVTFGPTKERNFSKKINKKMKRKALFMVLSDKAEDQNLIILQDFNIDEMRTKLLKSILEKLPVQKKILIVIPKNEEKIWKSARNLEYVNVAAADSINVIDILKHDSLLMPEESLEVIQTTFLKKQ